MALANLLKPPHLKRFLLALIAGVIALAVYFTAEHFQVVPATGALDAEVARPPVLGERSFAIIPIEATESEGLSRLVALELIRLLVRVPELEIIAPRSAFAFSSARRLAGKPPPPLDVAWLLEVRTTPAGEAVRFEASLLASGNRESAWALEQTRPEAEAAEFIETVIAELAQRFGFEAADQEGVLKGVEPSVFRDYLSAWLLQSGGPEALEEADRLLEGILEKLPRWAPALAADARNLMLRAARGGEEAGTLIDLARDQLEEAQALRPDLAEPFLYSSLLAHRFEWAWQSANDEAQRALALAPGDAEVLAAASTAAFTLGRFEDGAAQLRRAIALDPLVLGHRLKYGLMLEFDGRHQAAIDAYRELMVIDPDYPGAHAYLGRTLAIVGRSEAAYRHVQIEASPFWKLYGTVLALYALDRREAADARLEDLVRDHGFEAAAQIAELHAFAGRREEAFDWLARAVEQRDPGLAALLGNPLLQDLQDDPRWRGLLETVGLDGE